MVFKLENTKRKEAEKMLKRSLVAVNVLVMALPAVAGGYKVHSWNSRKTPYHSETVPNKIDVVLAEVGYSFRFLSLGSIKVTQDAEAEDPYRTYAGCAFNGVLTNFPTGVKVTIAGSGSLAGGEWSVTMKMPDGSETEQIDAFPGRKDFEICVQGKNVNIGALTGGAKRVHVADVTIQCCPR